jgi:hypothetical protein
MGRRVPSLKYPPLDISDLALNGYMLAVQQFGALILILYIGGIDSAETPLPKAVGLRRLYFSVVRLLYPTRESPISVCCRDLSSGHIPH